MQDKDGYRAMVRDFAETGIRKIPLSDYQIVTLVVDAEVRASVLCKAFESVDIAQILVRRYPTGIVYTTTLQFIVGDLSVISGDRGISDEAGS